ncbi:MAG: tRNA pseudouridine(55) synthase TruB [Caldimicrobium sp.]
MMKKFSGILVIDKPYGLTSTETLEKVKRILKVKKAGHGGTLDPIATGVLPIFLNEATKVAQIFLEGDKIYEGKLQLGLTTDTYDITGEILATYEVKDVTIEKLNQVAKRLVGDLEQIPPPYSAAKFRGRPLYKYARDGLFIPKEPKKVKVYQFDILSFDGKEASFYLKCSKGTYVRSLVHRLGEELGCGAVLSSLKRIQKSIFTLEMALTLEEVEKLVKEDLERIEAFILPISQALEFLPKVVISEDFAKRVREGKQINRTAFLSLIKFQKLSFSLSEKWIRLVDPKGKLVAILENPLLFKEKPYISYFRVFKDEP